MIGVPLLKKTLFMQRHDSQGRMEAGSPRAVSPSASLESRPSGYTLRSTKRRRVEPRGSPSTSQGSIVTVISGDTDIFDGRSNTTYRNWLQFVQLTATTQETFVEKKAPSGPAEPR